MSASVFVGARFIGRCSGWDSSIAPQEYFLRGAVIAQKICAPTRIHQGGEGYRWIDPAFPILSITPIRGWQHALQSVSYDNDLDRHDLCLVDNDYSETMVIHA